MKKQLLTLFALLTIVVSGAQTTADQTDDQSTCKLEFSAGLGAAGQVRFGDDREVAALLPMVLLEGRFTERSSVVLNVFFDANLKLFTFPLMYKFHTKIVDVALGPELGLAVGNYKRLEGGTGSSYCKYSLGLMLKVSKDITIERFATIEPFISFNPSSTVFESRDSEINYDFVGGVSLKWKL